MTRFHVGLSFLTRMCTEQSCLYLHDEARRQALVVGEVASADRYSPWLICLSDLLWNDLYLATETVVRNLRVGELRPVFLLEQRNTLVRRSSLERGFAAPSLELYSAAVPP